MLDFRLGQPGETTMQMFCITSEGFRPAELQPGDYFSVEENNHNRIVIRVHRRSGEPLFPEMHFPTRNSAGIAGTQASVVKLVTNALSGLPVFRKDLSTFILSAMP